MENFRHAYIHVPFCRRRCSYCDFSIAVRQSVPVDKYVESILAEVRSRGVRIAPGDLKTLYLGGGTPSLLGSAGVQDLLRRFGEATGAGDFSTSSWKSLELTLEANPEDVTPDAVRGWRLAGVNRVSIGVQSFDSGVLRWMHRGHDAAGTSEAVRVLRDEGIADVSLDLIAGVPEMLGRDWGRDLDLALSLDPTHLSVYGLTVEPHTPLGRWAARGEVREAPEDRHAAEFLRAHDRLTGAGYDHYEVSNYSLPAHRARHNSAYWTRVPYLGLGPSAHGFDGAVRRWNLAPYAAWSEAAGRDPIDGSERLGPDERLAEEVYLGLRTVDGLSIHQKDITTVTPWIEQGWAVLEPAGRLQLTPEGWLRLDALAAALTAARSRS
ncbi:MAG: radical SAM family heme chaperone HemW [Gemmatimonadota bacterium]|nr:radical SAM family heme chaperone HemW [Gemmatimonadota bacterium]MDQ8148111.1 radical SAM family heme chaperone HemW [Gemmatimonadota bacterium]MDQ8149758.1 radical SAM family heme chaperone HemW [Gemmatimonadota bacterium]MDQ8177453.1 radical SAM family heme chaperone HemW [Gemmatimonadota bacterium]